MNNEHIHRLKIWNCKSPNKMHLYYFQDIIQRSLNSEIVMDRIIKSWGLVLGRNKPWSNGLNPSWTRIFFNFCKILPFLLISQSWGTTNLWKIFKLVKYWQSLVQLGFILFLLSIYGCHENLISKTRSTTKLKSRRLQRKQLKRIQVA